VVAAAVAVAAAAAAALTLDFRLPLVECKSPSYLDLYQTS